MPGLIELKIKNVYRTKPSEDEGKRARRIHAEQSLKNAYMKHKRSAAKADPEKVQSLVEELSDLNVLGATPFEDAHLLAGRLVRELEKCLAIDKANEIAREMIRINFATDAAKPRTPSSRRKRA